MHIHNDTYMYVAISIYEFIYLLNFSVRSFFSGAKQLSLDKIHHHETQ